MPSSIRVAHLTSAHGRGDTRIFLKQCRSLQKAGYDVTQVVADGKGDVTVDGVAIVDVGRSSGRLDRMTGATRRVMAAALKLDTDIYHFHDPELIPVGLRLKTRGKKVIFDSHEDVAKQVMGKAYLNKALKPVVSRSYAMLERYAARRFDLIVCATPSIEKTFQSYGAKTVTVANYPILGELAQGPIDWSRKTDTVCYVGGLTRVRGLIEVIEAAGLTQTAARIAIAGASGEGGLAEELRAKAADRPVEFVGQLNRADVSELMARSVAGLVTFLPNPNHTEALPNKLFEYMSAGLPVIASDFPLWREILESRSAGVCVDPNDPRAIAGAIDQLVGDRNAAEVMGRNGQRAVETVFNWGIEEQRLFAAYDTVLSPHRATA